MGPVAEGLGQGLDGRWEGLAGPLRPCQPSTGGSPWRGAHTGPWGLWVPGEAATWRP